MYIGHYKSVSTPGEFYTKLRESLDFPAQVEVNNKRYLLNQTFQISSESQHKNFMTFAKANKVEYDIEI